MIANYGYEDGSGYYYITIDGNVCARCSTHACIQACPQGVYVIEMDDYDDMVAAVSEAARKRLRELCSLCNNWLSVGFPGEFSIRLHAFAVLFFRLVQLLS